MDVNLWFALGIVVLALLYVDLSRREWLRSYNRALSEIERSSTLSCTLLAECSSLRNQVKQAKRAPRTYLNRNKPALVLEVQKLNRAIQRRNHTIAHLRAQPAASSGEEAK